MNALLLGDIYTLISVFLSIRDMLSVSYVGKNPKYRSIFCSMWGSNLAYTIDLYFRRYFKSKKKYRLFRKHMVKKKMVVSGSFILSHVLGEVWDGGNGIDIFVEHSVNMWDFVVDLGFGCGVTSEFRINGNIVNVVKHFSSSIQDVDVDPPLCIISMGSIKNFKDLINEFELDICKNGFYYNKENNPTVFVTHLMEILRKRLLCEWNEYPDSKFTIKYKNRGFVCVWGGE